MLFTKKVWNKVTNFLLTIEDLNRLENGIFEALTKADAANGSVRTIYGRSTATGFTQNRNPYGSAFTDNNYTAVLHVNFSDYSDITFTDIPAVIPVAKTADPLSVGCSVYNVTKTGCDIVVRRSTRTDTGVLWQATGKIT